MTIQIRKSHRDRIYELLCDRIQRGEIRSDVRLVDTTLAAELGVSRMPVRDALMRLAAEGYLEPTTRGFVLPSLSVAEVLDIFDIRRLLEPRAVALATQAMGPGALGVARRAVSDAGAALQSNDTGLLFKATEGFRTAWLAVVPNQFLRHTIHRYLVQVQAVRLATLRDATTRAVIVAGLRDLLAAFEARDAVAAADRMQHFVFEGEAAFRRLCAES
ncbi:MAG: GntR family transcriptional regulator [Paracoccaceae bacterium]|nr:GntR family transcriptional regulator [Paracoccaceae bacterium]